MVSLDVSLYLAWLVPSALSFLASCLVVHHIVLKHPALRKQVFHQLTILLAVADLIQSGNWFIGVKYSAHYHQCAVQEYLLQLGLILKATISVIISGVAMYVVLKHKSPRHHIVVKITCLVLIIPFGLIVGSLYNHSARLYCNVDIPHYNDSSTTTQRAIMTYWVVTAFIYICAAINICMLSSIEYKLRAIRVSLASSTVCSPNMTSITSASALPSQSSPTVNEKMMRLVARLRMYPFIFVVLWMPEVITLLTILSTGTEQLVMRHITNVCGGSIGLVTAVSYFHFQSPVDYSKKRQDSSSSESGSYISQLKGKFTMQLMGKQDNKLLSRSSAMSSDADSSADVTPVVDIESSNDA